MAKRYVRGDRAFTRLIGRLPDVVRKEMIVQLNTTGREVLALAQAEAPVGPGRYGAGALRNALSMKVLVGSLKLKVGLIGKPINARIFYGMIQEMGRKGGGRGVKRGSQKYSSGVGAQPPKHFLYRMTRASIYEPFKDIWNRALQQVSAGLSSDD